MPTPRRRWWPTRGAAAGGSGGALARSRGLRAEPLLAALRQELGAATVVGAGAVEDASGRAHQWYRGEVQSGALAGLRLRGRARRGWASPRPADPSRTSSASPGPRANWILEIDGRPALDVYRKSAGGSLQSDLRRAALFVPGGLPRAARRTPLAPGRYLVRHLVGFAERERALAVPERVEVGDAIAFVHREPETARADLKEMLAPMPRDRGTCALWLACCARGAGFFGVAGLEAAYLEQALGATPVVGMLGFLRDRPGGGAAASCSPIRGCWRTSTPERGPARSSPALTRDLLSP